MLLNYYNAPMNFERLIEGPRRRITVSVGEAVAGAAAFFTSTHLLSRTLSGNHYVDFGPETTWVELGAGAIMALAGTMVFLDGTRNTIIGHAELTAITTAKLLRGILKEPIPVGKSSRGVDREGV